jgi:hypothetical protein
MKRIKNKKKQPISQALSMYNQQYQIGGVHDKQYMTMTPTQEQLKSGQFVGDRFGASQGIDYKFNPQMQAPQAPMPYADYAQKLAQNNPIEMQGYGQYNVDANFKPSEAIVPQSQNPLAADAGSGYQTETQGNPMNNEKFQFFNPYLGRDPQTSAYGLGESIQNKDALGIVGNSLHLLTNLGRNAFAGAGNAKRGQYVMQDAMEKYREGFKPPAQSMQQGGVFEANGIGTTPTNSNMNFDTKPIVKYQSGVMNNKMGQGFYLYSKDPTEQGFNVDRDREFVKQSEMMAVQRTPQWKAYMTNQATMKQQPKRQVAGFQDGGMAGQMPPQEEQMQEQGGQEQQLMMQVAEAIQGGADPNQIIEQLIQSGVPEETAVQMIQMIMQQMQGGQEQAPQGQVPQEEMYEMGGIKKKSLAKLLTGEYTAEKNDVEEEDIVAEVEGAEYIKTPEGQITQVLGDTHEKGGVQLTEEQLPENSEILSDHLKVNADLAKTLKEIGVTSKDTYARVLDKWTAKSGLKKIVEEQEEVIKKLEKQSKLLVERPSSKDTIKLNTTLLQEEISELEKEKAPLLKEKQAIFDPLFAAQEASKPQEQNQGMMQQGGTLNNDIIVKYAKKHGISPERANELVNEYKNGGVAKYQDGGRFDDFYKQSQRLGYTGKKQIGDIQQWMAKNHPDEVVSYFTKSGQPLTAKHVDILKKEAPWAFEMAGIPENKASANYTSEEKNKLFENYNSGSGNKSGENNKDFILRGFTDNKWDWRAPVIGLAPLTPAGMANTPQMQTPTAANPFLQTPTQGIPQAEIAVQKEDKFSNLDNAQRARTGLMALPNQYAQLPDPLQGALKLEYRPNLMENQNITADPIIAEIRRSEQNAMQSIQNLPDEQRAAAAAQIQANTQEQFNKTMGQVQAQNLQSNSAVANQNAQILNNSQDINNRYLMDYENKIYKAQAITDADRRNYFLHNQKVNLENFNAVNKANLYNQLADNYQLTDRGLELYNSPQLSYDGIQAIKTAEDKKKKTTKKDGGRFKKRIS